MIKKEELIYTVVGASNFRKQAADLLKVRANVLRTKKAIDKRLRELIVESGYMNYIPRNKKIDDILEFFK